MSKLSGGYIRSVKFALAGDESIEEDSYARIETAELTNNGIPRPRGVYDAHLGTMDRSYKCQTCHNSKRQCIGHPGHIELNYPVWSPMGIAFSIKWLKLACFECGLPIIAESRYMSAPLQHRLDVASKLARTPSKPCPHCNNAHPKVKKIKTKPGVYTASIADEAGRIIETRNLYPHDIYEILAKIPESVVASIGGPNMSHPRWGIIHKIPVPQVNIRPDTRKVAGGRSTTDDLTSMLQAIIKKNQSMPSAIPKDINQQMEKNIIELNNTYKDYIKSGNDSKVMSITKRLGGKKGRFRGTQLGKRARNIIRSTIAGDPTIRIDELGVPLVFAKTVQITETVQEYNKRRLLGYAYNGTKKYPGATEIIKRNGKTYDISAIDEVGLEPGDKVCRDLIDGDPINFNRQPSLLISNISTHKIRVIRNPETLTFLMNVDVCALYNADFDGDQMNGIIMSGVAARNEAQELSPVPAFLISHTTANPQLGQADDAVIGLSELTRSAVRFDKYHAMLIFANTTRLPSFAEAQEFTGRDCITKALELTPLNFTRGTQWYDPDMAAYIDYDPTEIKVVIDQGKHISGVLDKKSIGKGSAGGLYHLIANEYGAPAALDVMFNMQQMAIAFLSQAGYTIGIMDVIIPPEVRAEINSITSDMVNKSMLITEELYNGEIIPPIGKTIDEFFEARQINELSVFDEFRGTILGGVNHRTNNLFKLIMTGSKGKLDNLFNILSTVGQKLINGARIAQKFDYKRTLPYFPRFDNSPAARGYIANSYLNGMSSTEYMFNAMAARFDLIAKALSTSITGAQNRRSIKNLESTVTNNFRWATKGKTVMQFAYGDDFLDPRKLEIVRFETVMMSTSAFEQAYSHAKFPQFYKRMQDDRDKYRKVFMQLEVSQPQTLITEERRVAVNIRQVITNVMKSHGRLAPALNDATLAESVAEVEKLCANLPYVLMNHIAEGYKHAVPTYLSAATWLLRMLIRTHLHPKALEAGRIGPEYVRLIAQIVRLKYAQALVDPGTAVGIIAAQSFSEPFTQYMLDAHHRSASGGTSNSAVSKSREILGAKAVEALAAPSMDIPLLPEVAYDKLKVQEIANNIEVMRLGQFVTVWRIFYEKFAEPVHPTYAHEAEWIRTFLRQNPALTVPGDLTRWCIHFTLNRTTMILKNMTLGLIVSRLRDAYPGIFVAYTPEHAEHVILRVYLRNIMSKNMSQTKDIAPIAGTLLDTIIRGIHGIINANVVELPRHKVGPDGAVVREVGYYGIRTLGTNLVGVLQHPAVDAPKVITDAIQEIAKVFGIEAARMRIATELRNLMNLGINYRHFSIYADEMTWTGRVTSIEAGGLKARETSNILLRVGFSSPIATLEDASVRGSTDIVGGITAPFLIGSVPQIGTQYNKFHVNRDFIKANVMRPDDVLDSLIA